MALVVAFSENSLLFSVTDEPYRFAEKSWSLFLARALRKVRFQNCDDEVWVRQSFLIF